MTISQGKCDWDLNPGEQDIKDGRRVTDTRKIKSALALSKALSQDPNKKYFYYFRISV